MNLVAVNTFLTIVETGSLVRASERLNVTQSTVTARLKGLEAELGQTLLHRQKSGVSLTSNGFRFRRYAEGMIDLWRQARQETTFPRGVGTVCNLGCHIDLWPGLGRQMLDEIEKDHPSAVLSAWPGNQVLLEQWLGTGLIDAAITYRITTHESQTMHTLGEERLIMYSTRPGHLPGADPGYIYVDAGGDFGRRYTAAYSSEDFARISFGSAVWALEYLLDHGGSAYLPEHLALQPSAAGKLHMVDDAPVFTRERYLITNDKAATGWPWLPGIIDRLVQP
ncbi:MAG: LysR family transcriptional regulator [Hyphomicrobiales bacterium]|nr:LysR family transcriptional regulator [Hyphomicrobiales bacterium]